MDDASNNSMSPHRNTIKIKYDYSYGVVNAALRIFGFMVCAIAGIAAGAVLVDNIQKTESEARQLAIQAIICGVIGVSCFVGAKMVRRKKDEKFRQEMHHGKNIIGVVTKSNVRVVGRGRDRDIFHNFTVAYEDPETHEVVERTTPDTKDNGYINEDDLPLGGSIYIVGDKVYLDKIIDPPIEQIKKRKRKSSIFSLFCGILLFFWMISSVLNLGILAMICIFVFMAYVIIHAFMSDRS